MVGKQWKGRLSQALLFAVATVDCRPGLTSVSPPGSFLGLCDEAAGSRSSRLIHSHCRAVWPSSESLFEGPQLRGPGEQILLA